MKKIFCYIVLLISLMGCSKSPGELTQERIENDLNENGIHGKITIYEKTEDKDSIDLTVNVEGDTRNTDSYMTYKVEDGEWVLDKLYIKIHNPNYIE